MPQIKTFELDEAVLAKEIYAGHPHQTTPIGVVIEERVRKDLRTFLKTFLERTKCSDEFLRVDAFIRKDGLDIIEINVECQEGWGIALNLLRASNSVLDVERVSLIPREIIAYGDEYLPEFKLVQVELERFGFDMNIVSYSERPGVPIRSEFDKKMYLALLDGMSVGSIKIPSIYYDSSTPWDEVPQDVVFKFCEKYGEWSRKARYSVATRAKIGKGKFMRKCYASREAIAQKRIDPLTLSDGSVTQAIIMCAGAEPVTGYLQVAPPGTFIINDRTARKGPLVFID